MIDPLSITTMILTALKLGGPWIEHGLAMLTLARNEGKISPADFERIKAEGLITDRDFNAYVDQVKARAAAADAPTVDLDPDDPDAGPETLR